MNTTPASARVVFYWVDSNIILHTKRFNNINSTKNPARRRGFWCLGKTCKPNSVSRHSFAEWAG